MPPIIPQPEVTAFDTAKTNFTVDIAAINDYIDSFVTTYNTEVNNLYNQLAAATTQSARKIIVESLANKEFEYNSLMLGWATPINDYNQFVHDALINLNKKYLR